MLMFSVNGLNIELILCMFYLDTESPSVEAWGATSDTVMDHEMDLDGRCIGG